MWFNRQKKSSAKSLNKDATQSLLASLYSNGIDLSMQELLQYQNKSRLIDLAGKKNIQGKQAGNYLSRSKGRGMEFDEVRHYQTGDDVRAIDWRVTARTGKTHTKLFREEIERPVLVATDLSQNMNFGSKLLFKSVQGAHLAALIAWHAKIRGDRLGGLVFCDEQHIELKPRSRKAGVLHYLHALTTLNNQKKQTQLEENDSALDKQQETTTQHKNHYFEQHCARLRHLAKPGSLVYLITDGHALRDEKSCPHAIRHLSQISKHCELVLCLISDPLEQALPESSLKLAVTFTDGINRQQLTLGDNNTAEQYQQQALAQHEKMQLLLQSTGARVIHFSAGESLEQQLKYGASL
ncbi:DUF58 domain-containing protein [Colwellia psychrerythraea]|uniref:DUF58 domain-containing protein n=1 Tax=Colwellia psychrerythraea (strain 34H / ATCC BAA-681) TaxID=167879 RepID=Q47ZB3_COLP3|nr:DUF58 domain-containing protein [Colwellia psychrerythraea]AAZ28251.1 hypothetical protein CPS_3160 [Colwellia psychrerythraea 34H]